MLSGLVAIVRSLAGELSARLGPVTDAMSPITRRIGDSYGRFDRWRHGRPFGGSLVLVLAAVVIGYMPTVVAIQTLLLGGDQTSLSVVFAVFVALSGVGALTRPSKSTLFGATGAMFAMLSLLTTLGGFFVGTVLGIVGGSLCVAWTEDGTEGTT